MAFEALPREIRDNVVEKLLLEDTRMYPYAYPAPCLLRGPERYKAPDLAIMSVNKQVNAEATGALYSRATFVMTSDDSLTRFFFAHDDCILSHSYLIGKFTPLFYLFYNLAAGGVRGQEGPVTRSGS